MMGSRFIHASSFYTEWGLRFIPGFSFNTWCCLRFIPGSSFYTWWGRPVGRIFQAGVRFCEKWTFSRMENVCEGPTIETSPSIRRISQKINICQLQRNQLAPKIRHSWADLGFWWWVFLATMSDQVHKNRRCVCIGGGGGVGGPPRGKIWKFKAPLPTGLWGLRFIRGSSFNTWWGLRFIHDGIFVLYTSLRLIHDGIFVLKLLNRS